MAQLPAGAAGAAAGVLVWSFTCLLFNAVLLWLLWTSNERRSYIFLISVVTLLASCSSIVEQIHDIVWWNDVMTARFEVIKAKPDNPMVAASDGCSGVNLIMWTIRWGCYVAEAGIAFFWGFSLTQAVYCWRDDIRVHKTLKFINKAGKPFPIVASILSMSILQAPSLQRSYIGWNFVLNFFYCVFCAGGLFMFLLILLEYIQTRRMFRRMDSQQRKDYLHEPSFGPHNNTHMHMRSLSNATSVMTMSRQRKAGDDTEHFGALQQRQGGIYDKYLIARTFIPFVALCLFEIDNILINSSRPEKMHTLAATAAEPDLSAATASSYLAGFIPGCLASLVVPIAFGTTKQLRDKLYHTLVPARLQSADRRRRRSHEYNFFVDMDSDAGILSRNRRLSMEKRLRIEVTYEFEVRNEVVVVVVDDATAPTEKKKGRDTDMDMAPARGESSRGRTAAGALGDKKAAATTVRVQQVGGSKGHGKTASGLLALDLERPLPPTPEPSVTPTPEAGHKQEWSRFPYSVDSHGWNDTANILPKKPSISFMRGQM